MEQLHPRGPTASVSMCTVQRRLARQGVSSRACVRRRILMSSRVRRHSLLPVRAVFTLSLVVALVLAASSSRADKPEPALAFLAGSSVFFAGFAVGGVLLGTSNGNNDGRNNAGWLAIDAGFSLAPLVSHAVVGEWTRALVFTAPPVAVFGGSATLLAIHPATIERGELADQRFMWALFGIGLLSSIVGVVDACMAKGRARDVAIAPVLGPGQVGLRIGGVL